MTLAEMTDEELAELYRGLARTVGPGGHDALQESFARLWRKNVNMAEARTLILKDHWFRKGTLRQKSRDYGRIVSRGARERIEHVEYVIPVNPGAYMNPPLEAEAHRRVVALEILDALPPINPGILEGDTEAHRQRRKRWRQKALRVLASKGLSLE